MSWQLGLAMICILIGVPLLAVYATQASFWAERAKLTEWETALDEREAAVLTREFELGRRAHDLRTMLTMRQVAIEDDTTLLQMAVWDEPA